MVHVAVVGVGRIGVFHARHVQELGRETGACALVAVVDAYGDTARRVADRLGPDQETPLRPFTSVRELAKAGVSDAAVIASRTEHHYDDAKTLIDAGHRVLLEKPLTHSLESARQFVAELGGQSRQALMLAYQRRFDAALVQAKRWLDEGRIGTPFKYVSILEDPIPPPEGYQSPGLLPDMSVHNVDEVLWLSGARPTTVMAMGSSVFNYKRTTVREDFDDAVLQMWFDEDRIAQVQVSRNHVAGYRNESVVYGDRGSIHVGPFESDPHSVAVVCHEIGGRVERRVLALRNYGPGVPVFIERFGPAYKAEVADFVERCRSGEAFRVDQYDGLRALEIVEAGRRSLRSRDDGVRVEYES